MIFLGIDPGKKGALVAVNTQGALVWWMDMPLVGGLTVSVAQIVERLQDELERSHGVDTYLAFVERQQPMPIILRDEDGVQQVGKLRGTGIVAFRQGELYGQLCGICAALAIRYECVSPARWQRAVLPVLKGTTKDRAVVLVEQLFPALPIRGPKGALKDGRADAACLAEYGRRQFVRQALEVAQ